MTAPNTVPLTWNGFVSQIANFTIYETETVASVVQGTDDSFNTLIPQACNYAELRIERDLNLPQHQAERAYTLTSGNNKLTIPSDDFVTIQDVFVTFNGQTYPLLPVSKEFLQNTYGSSAGANVPQFCAVYGGDLATGGNTSFTLTLGPWPDQNYATTLVGTIRAPSLHTFATTADAGTKTTYISTYYPDLMIQAAMIPVAEFQRNFSATSNDPQMGFAYEQQYQTLLQAARAEGYRARWEGQAWSAESPSPVASPAR